MDIRRLLVFVALFATPALLAAEVPSWAGPFVSPPDAASRKCAALDGASSIGCVLEHPHTWASSDDSMGQTNFTTAPVTELEVPTSKTLAEEAIEKGIPGVFRSYWNDTFTLDGLEEILADAALLNVSQCPHKSCALHSPDAKAALSGMMQALIRSDVL